MINTADNPVPPKPEPKRLLDLGPLMRSQHWLPFVLPFAVFMLSGLIEPSVAIDPVVKESTADIASQAPAATPGILESLQSMWTYPLAYTVRMALTCCAVWLVLPRWKEIPWRCNWMAVVIGLVGGLLWIGICRLQIEDRVLTLIGLEDWITLGDRPHFDPYTALGSMPLVMVAFLAIRLVGLSVIIPLIEELFLRGFLMRFVEKADWWTIKLGAVSWKAALAATLYGVLAHPAEPLAAALWFSLITLLYVRTRNIWDCVVAHGLTNAMLGVYILAFRDWTLW